jgi:hypothetical protein
MSLDEIHVAVVDEDGDWTGTVGEVLEAHANLSVASGANTSPTVPVQSPSSSTTAT